MTGHEKIVEMRSRGMTPAVVFLNDFDCKTDWFENRDHATVSVTGDDPAILDLRYLRGLIVSVAASTDDRARSFLKACLAVGAKTVAVCGPSAVDDPFGRRTYAEIAHG